MLNQGPPPVVIACLLLAAVASFNAPPVAARHGPFRATRDWSGHHDGTEARAWLKERYNQSPHLLPGNNGVPSSSVVVNRPEPHSLRCYLAPLEGFKKQRIGAKHDGGYIVAVLSDNTYSALFSYGISNEISFEVGFLQEHPDIHAYMFDHTIKKLPRAKTGADRMHWKQEGVAGVPQPDKNLDTVENQLKVLNEDIDKIPSDLFLKMDVEGFEWESLVDVPTNVLLKFKQLVFEFHLLPRKLKGKPWREVLRRLNQYFYVAHVHGNNWAVWEGDSVPPALEVTYVRKDAVPPGTELHVRREPLPDATVDTSNHARIADLPLTYWLNHGCIE